VIRFAVWCALAVGLRGQGVGFTQLDRSVIDARFGRVSPLNAERATILRQIFAEAGCDGDKFEERSVRGTKFSNLVCTSRGSSDATLIVSAHYDKVKAGEGAIDNWSGAALLPSLFQSLAQDRRRVTFVFIAFCEEEPGEIGSRDFVGHLTRAERDNIVADVNIDSIGLTTTKVWVSQADKVLVRVAAMVSSLLHVPLDGVNVDRVGDSDSHPFREKKIPVIDFHSLTQATLPILHSAADVQSALDKAAYYDTYRFIAAFLAYLDAHPESQPTRPAK
jgi:hypothetical protein